MLPGIGLICGLAMAVQSHALVVLPGKSVDAGQWRVKPLSARVAAEHPLRRPVSPGQTYLIVEVELTNLMPKSSRDFGFVLRGMQPALGEPAFVLVRDMSLPDRLHPDMPEVMLAVWPWPEGTPVPAKLRLSVTAKTFKKADNLTGAPGWFNPKVVAVADIPVGAQ